MPATLESNLRNVLDDLEHAVREAGRAPGSVRLLPVTKSVDADTALALAALGRHELAENRLEGLLAKRTRFAQAGVEVAWHFIGHLQRNKARKVLRNASVLHSVDSERLLRTIVRIAREEGLRPRIYLEVKLSGEPEKHGISPAELEDCVRLAGAAPELALLGLMTMAARPGPSEVETLPAAACFEQLARLARGLAARPEFAACFEGSRVELSMGMSSDYQAAVLAGSDVCRVGSALFRGLESNREPAR